MNTRLTDAQAKEIAAWPLEDRDSWSESAAHRQFDAGMSRDEAEIAAYLEVKANRTRPATPGVR